MGLYSRYVLPKLIDKACSQPPMHALRDRYVSRATGEVLEIGIGSGSGASEASQASVHLDLSSRAGLPV